MTKQLLNAEGKPALEAKVAICVPSGDTVSASFSFDLARMVGSTVHNLPGVEALLFNLKGTILQKSRHELVKAALENECSHVLFLDADMRFPKYTLGRLLAQKQPVVGANYVTRRMPVQPITFADDSNSVVRVFTEPGETRLEEVPATGLGVMLIDTDVFRAIETPYFQIGWNPEAQAFSGEDVYFCRKVREAGIKILIDHGLSQHVAHIGEFEFKHEHALAIRQELPTEAVV
jgi:hypothetical protein